MKVYTDHLITDGVNAGENYTVYERACAKCGARVLIDKDYYNKLSIAGKLLEARCPSHKL